jgi:REP element-mobilizing transposase RayT
MQTRPVFVVHSLIWAIISTALSAHVGAWHAVPAISSSQSSLIERKPTMSSDSGLPKRRSIRLQDATYGSGCYFVTICTDQKKFLFGQIDDAVNRLSPLGQIAEDCWHQLPQHLPYVETDAFVVMPNHVHGILFMRLEAEAPMQERQFGHAARGTLATAVGSYKSAVTRTFNQLWPGSGRSVWQRGYHETIIRTQEAYDRIKEYIVLNPERWAEDNDNPEKGRQSLGRE